MPARTLFAGLAASAVTVSVLALGLSPAHAADPDDSTFVPVAADLVGVGSDTSQHALKLAADAWNAKTPAPAAKLATFAATGGGQVTLVQGGTPITRPNGSGDGKKALYSPSNPDVDYARSSSALSAAETQAGLQAFPFAVDELAMAVSGNTPSNAPATLTASDIVKIYKGEVTNWSQLPGGKPGVIAPKIPQSGSGTRSFFEAQLKSANDGVAVTLASTVTNVQEHDDQAIKGDANAVAPFSTGRAGLLGATLRLEHGWSAKRALYNVVRGADVNKPEVLAVFGADGFLCSNTARPLIEKAGFEQLARQEANGVCGVQTQAATSNFAANKAIATATTVTVTSTAPKKATVTAKVTADTAPQGTVEIFSGATKVAGPLALVSGQASVTLTSPAGSQSYKAVFTPEEDSNFVASEGTGTGVVKNVTPPVVKPPVVKPVVATSAMKAAFPKKVAKKATKAKGVITITLKGTSAKASGPVQVKAGRKVVGKATLRNGKATVTVKGLKKGKNKLTASWAGTALAKPAKVTFTITRKR